MNSTLSNIYKNEQERQLFKDEMINILKKGVQHNASDFHISSGNVISFRIDGDIKKSNEELTELKAKQLVYSITPENNINEFENEKETDFSFEVEGLARFRVNIFDKKMGMSAVLRTIPSDILSFEQLKLGDIFKEMSSFPRGLVLVTGPTGSGKSTTLASMIDYINENHRHHILTIEDPIEFVHKSKKCLISQRELSTNTKSFANALKGALREDPDVILVGEMRDLETIRLALTIAETGHLVFGTLHTTSASKTIDRIIDVFPAEEKEMVRTMLSETLKAVISQTLLKKSNSSGRVAAHEIMIVNHAIKNLIRENKVAQMYSSIQTGGKEGMTTLENSLIRLYQSGAISYESALEKANIKDEIIKFKNK